MPGRTSSMNDLSILELTEAARPPWLPYTPVLAPIVAVREAVGGTAIAWARRGATRRPIVVVDGERRLLFDVNGSIDVIREERYEGAHLSDPIVTRLPFDYARLPLVVIGAASRILTQRTDRSRRPPFPHYPLDVSADLLSYLRDGRASTLRWPEGKRWAVTFTHDVDGAWVFDDSAGRAWLDRFASTEEAAGVRSAWYCVPNAVRSLSARAGLRRLHDAGHEIGAHGHTHDPMLSALPLDVLTARLREARHMLGDHDVLGYRAPWLSRNATQFAALSSAGFSYDTSVPSADVARNNAGSNNGCGTVFPFARAGIVEMPVTLPQDSSRVTLGCDAHGFWSLIAELMRTIRDIGGVAVVSTHVQPHHSASSAMLAGYRQVLALAAQDPEAYIALPRDIVAVV